MPRDARRLATLLLTLGLLCAAVQAATIRVLVQSSPLAGFQHHAGQQVWNELREGDALVLVREPTNPHDALAIRVEWQGHQLGYLPRAENRAVATELDRGGRVEARIARLKAHRDPWQRILIDVFVVI
jgi:hypothetical protein